MKKVRLDELLVERELFADTQEALRAVLAHEVKVGDEYATSAAVKVNPEVQISVKQKGRFVSRGGFKLQGALDALALDVNGMRCIDVGSSTGGFTDCLLQAGAAEVTCVDVNYGQLAWSIRSDSRVRVFERTNIRTASPQDLGAPFELIVADLSFVHLATLAEVFAALSAKGSLFVGLIKPQFESRAGETVKGIVVDPEVRARSVEEVSAALERAGFVVREVVESSIKGTKGNIEFLVCAEFEGHSGGFPFAGQSESRF